MPIDYQIYYQHRIVVARGRGVFATADIFGYQREVWSRPDVAGFDELVDMTDVTEIATASPDRMRELAALSASMDRVAAGAKMAIVAPQDHAFGLGRMYEAYRSFEPASKKEVAVFRTISEALAFLGLEGAVIETAD
jgi:hypothetical protein